MAQVLTGRAFFSFRNVELLDGDGARLGPRHALYYSKRFLVESARARSAAEVHGLYVCVCVLA